MHEVTQLTSNREQLGLELVRQVEAYEKVLLECPNKFRDCTRLVFRCLVDAEKLPHTGPCIAWKLTGLLDGWVTDPALVAIAGRK